MRIIQIGVGGTGAWSLRALAHGLMNHDFVWDNDISWEIIDPDHIELKNHMRQPFMGVESIGTPKVTYNANILRSMLAAGREYTGKELSLSIKERTTLVTNPKKDLGLVDSLKDLPEDTIIILGVDNTYTRNKFEECMYSYRGQELGSHSLHYIDSGNNDKKWMALSVPAQMVPVVPYAEINLPDDMISCADREESSAIPQTTHQNGVSGFYVAQMALRVIHDRLRNRGEGLPHIGYLAYSNNGGVDLVQSSTRLLKFLNEMSEKEDITQKQFRYIENSLF